MQHLRLTVSAAIGAGLLLVDSVALVLGDALALGGVMGSGMSAMGSAALGLALADAGARQAGSEDGAFRSRLLWLGLAGLVWTCVLIGLGDSAAIPAVVALLWVVVQVAMFAEATDADDAGTTDPPA